MPKKLFKRFMPDHHAVRNHKYLRIFGQRLHDPSVWHLNRRSASGAVAVGVFMAFVPVPFQMVLAALGALWFRVNLPISVAMVWITNPITMPPMYYATYRFGNFLIGSGAPRDEFEFSYEWLATQLETIWQPFLVGSLVAGTFCAMIGFFAIRALWRLQVVRNFRRKKDARVLREAARSGTDILERR